MNPNTKFFCISHRTSGRWYSGTSQYGNPFFSDVDGYTYHGLAVKWSDGWIFPTHDEPSKVKYIRGSAPRPPLVMPGIGFVRKKTAVIRASLLPLFRSMQATPVPFQWDGYLDLPFGPGDHIPNLRGERRRDWWNWWANEQVLPRVRVGEQGPDPGEFLNLELPELHFHISMPKAHIIDFARVYEGEAIFRENTIEQCKFSVPPEELPPACWCYSNLILRREVYLELIDAFPASHFDIAPQAI